jgi:uncharacterized protein YjiS (DUF1127 family)
MQGNIMSQLLNSPSETLAIPRHFQLGLKFLFALWIRNYQTRKSLNGMEEHRLLDIGVDQMQAEDESRKPFWR